jgi:polyhydroxyalkanoate synthesis regulator phasin
MTKKVKDVKLTDKASEMAKNIWLAGLGAYGRAFDEAVAQYGKVSKDGSKMFDELVEKGRKLDGESHTKLSEAKTKTTATIEDRISKVRSSVNLSSLKMGGGDSAQLDELNSKVDVLSEKLDALLDSMGSKPKAAVAKPRSTTTA